MNNVKHWKGTHCTKMNVASSAKKYTECCPICLPKPKSFGFQWKKASLGVRSPCEWPLGRTGTLLTAEKTSVALEIHGWDDIRYMIEYVFWLDKRILWIHFVTPFYPAFYLLHFHCMSLQIKSYCGFEDSELENRSII